jgi:dipeptide/tripeptide permease
MGSCLVTKKGRVATSATGTFMFWAHPIVMRRKNNQNPANSVHENSCLNVLGSVCSIRCVQILHQSGFCKNNPEKAGWANLQKRKKGIKPVDRYISEDACAEEESKRLRKAVNFLCFILIQWLFSFSLKRTSF